MLCETIKYVNKEHIVAFYKTAIRKPVVFLKEVEIVYILMKLNPQNPPTKGWRGNESRKRNFSNAVFVTIFLPTTVSDIMANVILGLLPIKSNINLSMKYSLMTLGLFRSYGMRRKYPTKRMCVHMLHDTCQLAPDNLTNEDSPPANGDTTLASMKRGRNDLLLRLEHQIQTRLLLHRVYVPWVPCSDPESTLNGEHPEGHSSTHGI